MIKETDESTTPKMKATNRAEQQHKRVFKHELKVIRMTDEEIREGKSRYCHWRFIGHD